MGLLSAIGKFVETRFFPAVGVSGVSTAIRLVKEPVKEVTRAVAETVIALGVIYPTQALKLVGKAVTTSFAKAPVLTAGAILAAPAITIAAIKSPKIKETILGAPEAYVAGSVSAGETIATIIEEPTLANGLKIIKDHPYLTAATAAALLATFGYSGLLITNIISNAKLKGYLAEVGEEVVSAGATIPAATAGAVIPEKAIVSDEGLPIIPETATITTGIKRRRKAKAAIIPSMRQNVQVILSSKNIGYQINKRYLNQRILA